MASSKPTFRLTITLASGDAHSFEVAKMPRHWNSWLMQQLPYGTVFQGATFSREPAAACAFCGAYGATDVYREEDHSDAPCCADEDACHARVLA